MSELYFGRKRVFRPIVPQMWPQQFPCFYYIEVPLSEAEIKRSPVVTFEEFEVARSGGPLPDSHTGEGH